MLAFWADCYGLGAPLLSFDVGALTRMNIARNVYEAIRDGDAADNFAEWSRRNPGAAEIHAAIYLELKRNG